MILEFSKPRHPLFRRLYQFYFTRVLPRVGGIVSRSAEAYQYLPCTVQTFPEGEELLAILTSCGYVRLRQWPVSLGIATITIAEKPQTL
jgi:demethylmenaquinone methyltransferase/2-methoxy-6-polyprenyl-1,4-benzoquinol methylase